MQRCTKLLLLSRKIWSWQPFSISLLSLVRIKSLQPAFLLDWKNEKKKFWDLCFCTELIEVIFTIISPPSSSFIKKCWANNLFYNTALKEKLVTSTNLGLQKYIVAKNPQKIQFGHYYYFNICLHHFCIFSVLCIR